eukprot:1016379-Rhodomonas_salina.1
MAQRERLEEERQREAAQGLREVERAKAALESRLAAIEGEAASQSAEAAALSRTLAEEREEREAAQKAVRRTEEVLSVLKERCVALEQDKSAALLEMERAKEAAKSAGEAAREAARGLDEENCRLQEMVGQLERELAEMSAARVWERAERARLEEEKEQEHRERSKAEGENKRMEELLVRLTRYMACIPDVLCWAFDFRSNASLHEKVGAEGRGRGEGERGRAEEGGRGEGEGEGGGAAAARNGGAACSVRGAAHDDHTAAEAPGRVSWRAGRGAEPERGARARAGADAERAAPAGWRAPGHGRAAGGHGDGDAACRDHVCADPVGRGDTGRRCG